MRNTATRYALIVFIITVLWTLLEHVMGFNTTRHEIGQNTRMVTAFVYYIFVAMAIWNVRRQQGNTLTFAEGMKTGSLIAVIYSLLVTLWFALYAEVINKQYKPTLMAFERNKAMAKGATPAELAAKMKEVDMQSGGSVGSYLLLFGFMFLFGIVVSLIAAALMKRKPQLA